MKLLSLWEPSNLPGHARKPERSENTDDRAILFDSCAISLCWRYAGVDEFSNFAKNGRQRFVQCFLSLSCRPNQLRRPHGGSMVNRKAERDSPKDLHFPINTRPHQPCESSEIVATVGETQLENRQAAEMPVAGLDWSNFCRNADLFAIALRPAKRVNVCIEESNPPVKAIFPSPCSTTVCAPLAVEESSQPRGVLGFGLRVIPLDALEAFWLEQYNPPVLFPVGRRFNDSSGNLPDRQGESLGEIQIFDVQPDSASRAVAIPVQHASQISNSRPAGLPQFHGTMISLSLW